MSASEKSNLHFKLLASAISLLFSWIMLEIALPFLDHRLASYFHQPVTKENHPPERASAVLTSETFDPDLGWDRQHPIKDYVEGTSYFAQAYGDSFVKSGNGGHRTWQETFRENTGQGILNFGVGGYGLDQALLKFEKHHAAHKEKEKTRLVILGIFSQPLRRSLSRFSFYYFQNKADWEFVFKPQFVKSPQGIELLKLPCQDAQCLNSLMVNRDNPVFDSMAKHDYWYQQDLLKPPAAFPRLFRYAKAFPRYFHKKRQATGEEPAVFVTPFVLELSQYLIERFVQGAQEQGVTPILLLMYTKNELQHIKRGYREDAPLVQFLEHQKITYIDTAPYFIKHHSMDDGFESLFLPNDGHYNLNGDVFVAQALQEGLEKLGLMAEPPPVDGQQPDAGLPSQ